MQRRSSTTSSDSKVNNNRTAVAVEKEVRVHNTHFTVLKFKMVRIGQSSHPSNLFVPFLYRLGIVLNVLAIYHSSFSTVL